MGGVRAQLTGAVSILSGVSMMTMARLLGEEIEQVASGDKRMSEVRVL